MGKRIWKKVAYYSRKYVMVRIPAIIIVTCAIFIRLVAKYQARTQWYRRVAVATAMSLVLMSVIPMSGITLAGPEDQGQVDQEQPEADVYEPTEDDFRNGGIDAEIVATTGSYTDVDGVEHIEDMYVLRVTNRTPYDLIDDLQINIENGQIAFLEAVPAPDHPEASAEVEPETDVNDAPFTRVSQYTLIKEDLPGSVVEGEYSSFDIYLGQAAEPEEDAEEEATTEALQEPPVVDQVQPENTEDAEQTDADAEDTDSDEPSDDTTIEPEPIEPQETTSDTVEEPSVSDSDETDAVDTPSEAPAEVGESTAALSVVENRVMSVALAPDVNASGEETPVYPVIKVYFASNLTAEPLKSVGTTEEDRIDVASIIGSGVVIMPQTETEEDAVLQTGDNNVPVTNEVVAPEEQPATPATPDNASASAAGTRDDKSEAPSAVTAPVVAPASQAADTAEPSYEEAEQRAEESADAEVETAGEADTDVVVGDDASFVEADENTEAEEDAEDKDDPEEEEKNRVKAIDENSRPDDIISVTLPTTFAIPMFSAGSEIDVMSEPIVVENHSDFPVDVNITTVDMKVDRTMTRDEIKSVAVETGSDRVYDLEKEAKTCHLTLQVLIDEVKNVFNIEEGVTKDLTSFTLGGKDDTKSAASISLYGEATYGLTGKWDDGDLKVSITFDFRKHGETEGQDATDTEEQNAAGVEEKSSADAKNEDDVIKEDAVIEDDVKED